MTKILTELYIKRKKVARVSTPYLTKLIFIPKKSSLYYFHLGSFYLAYGSH